MWSRGLWSRCRGVRRLWGAGGGAACRRNQPGYDDAHHPSRPTEKSHGNYSFARAWLGNRSRPLASLLANALYPSIPPRADHDSRGHPELRPYCFPMALLSAPAGDATRDGVSRRAQALQPGRVGPGIARHRSRRAPECVPACHWPHYGWTLQSNPRRPFSMLNRGRYAGQYADRRPSSQDVGHQPAGWPPVVYDACQCLSFTD